MRAVGEPYRGGRPGDFFHGDDVCQIAEIRAAVVLLHGDPEQAKFPELSPHLLWKDVVAVDLCGYGCDFLFGEALHAVPEHIDRFPEREVETRHACVLLLLAVSGVRASKTTANEGTGWAATSSIASADSRAPLEEAVPLYPICASAV